MPISVNELLEEKARRYGTAASSSTFQQQLLDSLAYALDDVDERLGLTTARPTNIGSTIALNEQDYRGVLSLGIDRYMALDGQWEVADRKELDALYERKLSFVHMNYLRGLDLSPRYGDPDA